MQLNKCTHLTFVSGAVIFMMSCASGGASVLTPEEIADTIAQAGAAEKFCGPRLHKAMKLLCTPPMKALILRQEGHIPVKKSMDTDLDFENFNLDQIVAENYDDEMNHGRSKLDDSYFSNDLAYLTSQQENHRRRRGIVDECCKKACFKIELIAYCPPPRAVRLIH